MLVNDANGKHLVATGVLYVIYKYVYKKYILKNGGLKILSPFFCAFHCNVLILKLLFFQFDYIKY